MFTMRKEIKIDIEVNVSVILFPTMSSVLYPSTPLASVNADSYESD